MKTLVTGAAGFIGSHLCDSLHARGQEIVAIDDLSLGKTKNIKHLFGSSRFTFIQNDIKNFQEMEKIFNTENFEIVYHLAANSDIAVSNEKPEIDLDRTFQTTFTLLSLMRKYAVKKLVFASTSAIYGDTSKLINEDFGPLKPVSHYGAAKLASEAFISSFCACYDFKVWITRFPNVVGERATHGVLYDLIRKLKRCESELEVLGDGEQFKPYLYVKDLVSAILFVVDNTNDPINLYNIGVDSRTRVKEIVGMIVEEMNLTPQIKYKGGSRGWKGDVPEFNYDLSKIHGLGWSAKRTSNEAVRKSIRQILMLD